MLRRRPALSVAAILVLVAAIYSSCYGSNTDTAEPTEPVHLVMYLIGTEPELNDRFEATLNRYLLEDFNATMDVRYIDWSNLASEYQLIFVSHEQVDLIYTAHWCFYTDIVREGGFVRLDDLLAEHPDTWNSLPEEAWDIARVDGSIYAVPANQHHFSTTGLIYRRDLVDEPQTIDSFESLEQYMAAVKSQTDILPFDVGGADDFRMSLVYPTANGYVMMPTPEARVIRNPDGLDPPVVSMAETDGYRDHLRMLRRWAEAGYWQRNAMNRNSESWISFEEGESAVAFALPLDARDLAERVLSAHPDWEIGYWPLSDIKQTGGYLSPMQDAMAIGSTSVDPELSMEILETIRTNRRYFDLFFYGIPSIHYVANDSGQFRFIEGSGGWSMCNWGFRNEPMQREQEMLWDEWESIKERLESYSVYGPLTGFSPDMSVVADIRDRIRDLQISMHTPLIFGAFADPDKALDDYLDAVYDAGFQEYLDELGRQVREFLEQE